MFSNILGYSMDTVVFADYLIVKKLISKSI